MKSTVLLWMIGWRKLPSMNWTARTSASASEPDLPALVGERDEDGDKAGDERADERDERAEEDEHGERERERHTQKPEADPDQRRVDRGDQRRAADEAAQHGPHSPAGPIDAG